MYRRETKKKNGAWVPGARSFGLEDDARLRPVNPSGAPREVALELRLPPRGAEALMNVVPVARAEVDVRPDPRAHGAIREDEGEHGVAEARTIATRAAAV